MAECRRACMGLTGHFFQIAAYAGKPLHRSIHQDLAISFFNLLPSA